MNGLDVRLLAGVFLCVFLGGCGARTATLAFYPEQLREAEGLVELAEPEMVIGVSADTDITRLLPAPLESMVIQSVTSEIGYTSVAPADESSVSEDSPLVRFYSVPLAYLQSTESLIEGAARHPWDIAHQQLLDMQNKAALTGVLPFIVIEPDLTLIDPNQTKRVQTEHRDAEKSLKRARAKEGVTDTVLVPPSKVWPAGEAFWHKGDEYSQLTSAAKRVGERLNGQGSPVVIAQLDTGYHKNDAYIPRHLDGENSLSFTGGNQCSRQNDDGGGINHSDKPRHGQRMLSVLAGREATIEGITDTLGGDPYASIRVYRIAEKSVVHLSTRRMTAAIDCARQNEVDVISISAGGLPSIAQRNAVNAAYENGVAIFAATGDFFHIPFTKIKLLGESAVFPARYNRVIGVAGATHEHKSYGASPSYWKLLDWPIKPLASRFGSWMLRGSFGPESAMAEHTVAGYAPNIDHGFSMNESRFVRRNGAGTSSSTPQAAAAASLWLAQEKEAIGERWRSWEKTEAVYQAMLKAAAATVETDRRYKDVARFGEGPVKANDMLDIRYSDLQGDEFRVREKSRIGYVWFLQTLESSNLLSLSPSTRVAQLDMLLTEVVQVAETSARARRDLAKVQECMAQKKDCGALIASTLDKLVKKEAERMSETLKANLINGLKELRRRA